MTTKGDDTPQHVDLNAMMAKGGREAAVAFHLLSIEYHAAIIESSGDMEDLDMRGALLAHHLVGVRALLGEAEGNPGVVTQRLIVPGRS